jgi:hypothetical protein
MEGSISRYVESRYPEVAAKIREDAKFYRGKDISLGELDDFRKGVNSELDVFYAKNNLKRADALKDPQIGYRVAEADAIRDLEYESIQKATGEDMRQLKRLQGDINEIRRAAQENFDRLTVKDAKLRGQSLTKKFWDAAEHTLSSHPVAGIRQFADLFLNRGSRELRVANDAASRVINRPSRIGAVVSKTANVTGKTSAILSGSEDEE